MIKLSAKNIQRPTLLGSGQKLPERREGDAAPLILINCCFMVIANLLSIIYSIATPDTADLQRLLDEL
ncbi:MAG: hypothetical protein HKP12_16005 [Gammaproteobacteria bacterium]|nr:hypothetical protein [Gammaproteobacteria bacterium]